VRAGVGEMEIVNVDHAFAKLQEQQND
jgi:hypothetical protein